MHNGTNLCFLTELCVQDVVAIPAPAVGGTAFLTAFSATSSAPLSYVPLRFSALLPRQARNIHAHLANVSDGILTRTVADDVDLDGYVDALATLVMTDGSTAVRLLRNVPCTASTSGLCFGYADGEQHAASTVPRCRCSREAVHC